MFYHVSRTGQLYICISKLWCRIVPPCMGRCCGFFENCLSNCYFDYGCNAHDQKSVTACFLDISNPEGIQVLAVSVRYFTIMVLSFPILHILHVFRNILQALGGAILSLMSGFAELAARILMSQFVIGYIGADALFLSEPASWLGSMVCVFLPYFYYRPKLLK